MQCLNITQDNNKNMNDISIVLPSKPKIVSEEGFSGVYEIDGLYPGYGHTLGNSLRRIILASLPGAAITQVKIAGVQHEFSTIQGVKEDVITILLNLKRIRMRMTSSEPQKLNLKVKGPKMVTAADIEAPGQVEILNADQEICSLADAKSSIDMEITVERGIGYMSREIIQKTKMDIGALALDAIFAPIRRASYEVEQMRVGDRTDFNRLRLFIETDGTITPKEALEKSIELMINQLKAIVGFKEEEPLQTREAPGSEMTDEKEPDSDILKTRIESIGLSARTLNSLSTGNIRTVGGLARKREKDLLEVDGLGAKGIQEIRKALSEFGITLKD
jgi:DNA-directed RNA polymerase subunit alpha